VNAIQQLTPKWKGLIRCVPTNFGAQLRGFEWYSGNEKGSVLPLHDATLGIDEPSFPFRTDRGSQRDKEAGPRALQELARYFVAGVGGGKWRQGSMGHRSLPRVPRRTGAERTAHDLETTAWHGGPRRIGLDAPRHSVPSTPALFGYPSSRTWQMSFEIAARL
jgi:hypothetical protein